MSSHPAVDLVLAETAAAEGPLPDRAESMLRILRGAVDFDRGWLAATDPSGPGYYPVASVGLDRETDGSPPDPDTARRRTPGTREPLTVALIAPRGRRVGFLALVFGERQPPSPAARRRLARLAPVLAQGVDPMRSVMAAARLVPGATAGVVLRADGACHALPGLPDDALLRPGSPVMAEGRERLHGGHLLSSFLWPRGGQHAPRGHVRVTVVAAAADVPPGLAAVALLSPAGQVRGLTARELEVLGLLVEGCANQEIAHALVVTPRTVATHVEHVLAKLDAPTRTLAAVRAERDGLYVPASAVATSR